MLQKPMRTFIQIALLTLALLGFLGFSALYLTPSAPLWRHRSGHMLTQVQWLSSQFWGHGTTPIIMDTATGARINSGSETKYGCLVVYHYDLRIWSYDAKTGIVSYSCG